MSDVTGRVCERRRYRKRRMEVKRGYSWTIGEREMMMRGAVTSRGRSARGESTPTIGRARTAGDRRIGARTTSQREEEERERDAERGRIGDGFRTRRNERGDLRES